MRIAAGSRDELLNQTLRVVLTQKLIKKKKKKETKSFSVLVGSLFCQVSELHQGVTIAEASTR